MGKRTCFVISTIGERDSDERKLADDKFDFVYRPICEELGYIIKRADKEARPNLITRDIIQNIINSEMVIADVSETNEKSNANVFYELAVRNAVKKPVVVVKNIGQTLPFDIHDKRAISINMREIRQWNEAKEQLKEYIKNAESDPDSASESILVDFSFKIGSKIEGGVNELSIQVKDLRDEVHSFIESMSDRTSVSETVKSSGNPVSPQSATGSIPGSSASPFPYGIQYGVPTLGNIEDYVTKSMTRKCPRCGRESMGLVSGICIPCSMTRKCSKCKQDFITLNLVDSQCLKCSMAGRFP